METFKGPIPRGLSASEEYKIVRLFILFVLERLTVAYSRSSGPGGQNVNKGS